MRPVKWMANGEWELPEGYQLPTKTLTNITKFQDLVDTGQDVDDFVGALLLRIADADIRFDRGVPVFPPRLGAPVLTVEDVDRLANGQEA